MIDAAHKIRDGAYKTKLNTTDAGEVSEYFLDDQSSIARTFRPSWLENIWQNDLAELPVTDDVRRELAWFRCAPRWRSG